MEHRRLGITHNPDFQSPISVPPPLRVDTTADTPLEVTDNCFRQKSIPAPLDLYDPLDPLTRQSLRRQFRAASFVGSEVPGVLRYRTMADEAPVNPLKILAQAPLFGGLPAPALQTALDVAHYRRVEANAFFFHQDEPATTFYVLLEGRLRLSQLTPEGHQVIIRIVGPGEGIGIIVALSNVNYPLSAEAMTDCLALGWDGETVIRLMEQYSQLAINGMRLIAQRFADLQNRYRELATERVERRVARTLLRLVRQVGKRVEEGILIDMPLSRQDLAEMTGTTIYTVSRILSDWEQRGLVASGRERVVLCKSHELVVIAEDLPAGRDA